VAAPQNPAASTQPASFAGHFLDLVLRRAVTRKQDVPGRINDRD